MSEDKKIEFGGEFEQTFEPIDDGDYEFVIESVKPGFTKTNNKRKLDFRFKIRSDVDQKFKGRVLFYTVTERENDVFYDFNKINKIISTQLKTGEKKSFDGGEDEILQFLHNIHLVATVITEYDDYSGKDRNRIKDFSFKPSVWDTQEHAELTKAVVDNIPDNDLPF